MESITAPSIAYVSLISSTWPKRITEIVVLIWGGIINSEHFENDGQENEVDISELDVPQDIGRESMRNDGQCLSGRIKKIFCYFCYVTEGYGMVGQTVLLQYWP